MDRQFVEDKLINLQEKMFNKTIVIWGASHRGIIIWEHLKQLDYDDIIFIDSYLSEGEFNGIKLSNPDYLKDKIESCFVLVAIAKHYKDIEDRLESYGYRREENYFYFYDLQRVVVSDFTDYSDKNGNVITGNPKVMNSYVIFSGRNNKIHFDENVLIENSTILFQSGEGVCSIGKNSRFRGSRIFIGKGCEVSIGQNLWVTKNCEIMTSEYTSLRVGDDCLFASDNEIKTDDGHPIFDIHTTERVNISRSINIGSHVWLSNRAVILAGASVGDGSVIGHSSVVKSAIPNNCVAVGVPAKVVKKDIAWERTHLSSNEPYYFPDGNYIDDRTYWNKTEE